MGEAAPWPIGHWIVDFASLRPKIVIEVDDPSHETRDEAQRSADIEAQGFEILRFTNRQVARDLDEVMEVIVDVITQLQDETNC